MPLSLNSAGLQTQTEEEIRDELVAELRSTFGVNINTNTRSILGQLINIWAELFAVTQQALLGVYRSFDPNAAIGVSLDQRAVLTGSLRRGATFSVVKGDLEFTGIGTISNGDRITNTDTGTFWELVNGPFTAAGPSIISGAQFQAIDPGPVVANAGTNWGIVTAVPGLAGFSNPLDDANLGSLQESDPEFRERRNIELFARGQGPLAAISAVVSKVDGVLSVRTYHNPSVNPVDSDGIPFKAFNVVVETQPPTPPPELQQAIFDAIWSATGAGGQAFALPSPPGPAGTFYSGIVVDSEGTPQPSAFNTVSNVDVFIDVELVTSTSENAITPNIETVVSEALLAVALENWQVVGRDVLSFDVIGVVNDLIVSGKISGVDEVRAGVGSGGFPGLTPQKLEIAIREKAEFNSAAIAVGQV